ncbi:MAG: heptosyltransferase-2 [Alteromonadaceae bacterium]
MFTKEKIKNIVIFMPRFIGDCINCTPSIKMLKEYYPACRIYLVIREPISKVLANEEDLNFIYDTRQGNRLKGSLALIKQLGKIDNCACIFMTNTLQDALISYLAKNIVRVGYATEQRGVLLTNKLKFDRNRHYINRYAYLANELCNNQFKKLPEVSLNHTKNSNILNKSGQIIIGICILSDYKGSRHYPINQTIEFVGLLKQTLGESVHFIMLGSKEEQTTAEQVVKGCIEQKNEQVTSLAGKTTIVELIADIAALDLLITVDSGPLHIAAATKTPVVALHSKGTSPFSLICPKGTLVNVVNSRGSYINDSDQIIDLLVEDIVTATLDLIKDIDKKGVI